MRKPETLRPEPTPELEAYRFALRTFLVDLLAWMLDTLDKTPKRGLLGAALRTPAIAAIIRDARRAVARDLRDSVRHLKMYLLALAYVRTAPLIEKRIATTHRPPQIPDGFRRARQRAPIIRHIIGDTLAGFHRGSLRERAERIRDALDNPETYVAHIATRIVRMLHHSKGPALVLICAQDAVRHVAPAIAREAADSS